MFLLHFGLTFLSPDTKTILMGTKYKSFQLLLGNLSISIKKIFSCAITLVLAILLPEK